MPHLLMHGELDDGKDIGRFAMSQGRRTPILSEIGKTGIRTLMYLLHSNNNIDIYVSFN